MKGFCRKSWPKVKKVVNMITPALEELIQTTLGFTGGILRIMDMPEVSLLLPELVPKTWDMQNAMKKAIDELTRTKEILGETDPVKKLSLFVIEVSKLGAYDRNSKVVKLAQLMVAIRDGRKHSEKEYDTMVQTSTLLI